jgi:hypothetical protein
VVWLVRKGRSSHKLVKATCQAEVRKHSPLDSKAMRQ